MIDNVNHPSHYTSDKSGVECIEITRHRNFNIGNAIKYLWRAGLKGGGNSTKEIEDLKKAIFYITREIENIEDDIADAEEELSTWTTSDYSKKLYDEILDSAKEAHPAGKGIRVEDCEVVEDDYCWDDGPCNICAEDDRDLRPEFSKGGYTGEEWLKGFEVVARSSDGSFTFTTDKLRNR